VTTTQERVLNAAIDLLGTEGLRALTHTRIDAKAGVPKGSTSNYFRTRAALLEGVVDWMVKLELPAVGIAYAPDSPGELANALCGLFEEMTGPDHRTMTSARLVLLMEASHDSAVREALGRGRSAMEELVIPSVTRLGAPDPKLAANALAACFEGLFLQRIARHADVDAKSILHTMVGAFVG
jgi:AcrR family transcriptional regulator